MRLVSFNFRRMDYRGKKLEEENDKKATLLSLTLHTLLLLAAFFMPSVQAPPKPPDSKIQVELPSDLLGGGPSLGLPDQGRGNNPSPGEPDPNAGNSTPSKPEPTPPAPTPVKPAPAPKPVISKPVTPPPSKRVETTEDPAAVAIRRQQEETRKRVEEEKYRQVQVEKEKKRQADATKAAEAQKQAEAAERQRAEQAAKDKFKGRFGTGTQSGQNGGGGTGDGRGNTGKPGNQGKPDGDPNSDNLDKGFGRGPGVVNGFGGRGVKSAPKLQENSQKSGKIVIQVCVDASGNVLSADYKAVGSTSNDQDLIDAAKRNARQYKFAAGSADKQCGTITYNFRVQ